jgi:MoaA/NifB/PqqE/SkfB family radical SAM enzyme
MEIDAGEDNGRNKGHQQPWKLWVYTNFDCNLSCSYCLARSTPRSPRQEMGLETVKQLVDEAAGLGFDSVYFTGGEPLILDSIYAMLAYASERLPTTLLTNGMLAHGRRLERLAALDRSNLTLQVSLDGARPEQHDAYRGSGSWQKTVEAIHRLQEYGFHLRLSTTETPANSAHLGEVSAFREALGITEADHFIRPLAKRGFSGEGLEVCAEGLVPELTVSIHGVYWHPVAVDEDMLVHREIFPLELSVRLVEERLRSAHPAEPVKTLK